MKHNVFETKKADGTTISHEDVAAVFKDVKMYGSLRDSVIAHGLIDEVDALAHEDADPPAQTYGIRDINYLFPDVRNYTTTPEWIKNTPEEWIGVVMNGIHKTPFSRVRTMFADITADEARAKGYIKGNLKTEQVFSLLKRETTPTTIYKKQKLNRDDVVDITSFDVVAWIKSEMRMKLDEEVARAILIGDGRGLESNDKINGQNIRPVVYDDDLFNVKYVIDPEEYSSTVLSGLQLAPIEQLAKVLTHAIVKAKLNYKGSGSPVFFTNEAILTGLRLVEDVNGRPLYESDSKIADALRVSRIVPVPYMDGLVYNNQYKDSDDYNDDAYVIIGTIVGLNDYNVGTDRGGAISMFDDFDIDYNQQKYLMETRMSGALVKPYSAITLLMTKENAATYGLIEAETEAEPAAGGQE